MNRTDLVKVMLDYTKGAVQKYSLDEANELIRQALIAANGNSTTLDLRVFRRNPELFDIIEEYIDTLVASGLSENDFFNKFVDVRNIKAGDSVDFIAEKEAILVVSEVANGMASVRRQRIGEFDTVNLKPSEREIRVYDEIGRILAGKADIAKLGALVSKGMADQRMTDAYSAWAGLTAATLPGYASAATAGTYDEDELGDVIAKTEAANGGEKAMLITTLKGARTIKANDGSERGKDSLYMNGYAQKWYGTDVLVVPQRFKAGTTEFAFPDNKVYVVTSSMDKPIKQVIGGSTYFDIGANNKNTDRSIDIVAIESWATGVVIGKSFGVYDIGTAAASAG